MWGAIHYAGQPFLVRLARQTTGGDVKECQQEQIKERLNDVIAAAHNGVVTYTAAISNGERVIARAVREQGFPLVVLLNDGFPKEGSQQERYYKPGGVYFDACSKGKLLLMEPDESSYTHPDVMASTVETLRRKAEAKHLSYRDVPIDTQRYRFVALNEMGRMMVSRGGRCRGCNPREINGTGE